MMLKIFSCASLPSACLLWWSVYSNQSPILKIKSSIFSFLSYNKILFQIQREGKSLSCVRLFETPWTAAYQAPPSMGFSRQEHWSGLPFPSPTLESKKWKWSRSVVSDPQRPHGLLPSRLLRPWDFPGRSTRVGCHCLLHSRYKSFIKRVLFKYPFPACGLHHSKSRNF